MPSADSCENPLHVLSFGRRRRVEAALADLFPWMIPVAGMWLLLFAFDRTVLGGWLPQLFYFYCLVLPVPLAYLVQIVAIRRFEGLLRRIPWDELRTTRLTARELHQWAVVDLHRRHVYLMIASAVLTWGPVLVALPAPGNVLWLGTFIVPSLLALALLMQKGLDVSFVKLFEKNSYFLGRFASFMALLPAWFALLICQWIAIILTEGLVEGPFYFALPLPPILALLLLGIPISRSARGRALAAFQGSLGSTV